MVLFSIATTTPSARYTTRFLGIFTIAVFVMQATAVPVKVNKPIPRLLADGGLITGLTDEVCEILDKAGLISEGHLSIDFATDYLRGRIVDIVDNLRLGYLSEVAKTELDIILTNLEDFVEQDLPPICGGGGEDSDIV